MQNEKPRILFMGTPQFAVSALELLIEHHYPVVCVVTQPDRAVGRKRILTPPPVKEVALRHGIEVFQPERIRRTEALEKIAQYHPELIVTAAYGQILPVQLLALAPVGALNLHASLLPRYRGAAPIQWAIMRGEKQTGVTIMTMVKELDAGPIWDSVSVDIGADTTYGELQDMLAQAGAKLLIEVLPKIVRKELQAKEQNAQEATFAPPIKRVDEQLDFTQLSHQVYNHVRALSPVPGAYTHLGDQLFKVWSAKPLHDWHGVAEPGMIVELSKEGPVIACGRGAIIATKVQLEGKKIQSGDEFVRGLHHADDLRCIKQ